MGLANDVLKRTADRRGFLKGAGVAGLAVASSAVLGTTSVAAQTTNTTFTATDIEVLNFALNLEYVEAEFYTKAFYGLTLEEFGIPVTGTGKSGPTTGGKRVHFEEEEGEYFEKREYSHRLKEVAKQITLDEQTHVRLLRELLGSKAIAKPAINLDAMGSGFGDFSQFLALARVFEDVGVSAYGGAATLLSTLALGYAARIALVEAYHASTLRFLVAENHVQSLPVDGLDVPPPPTGEQYFTTVGALSVVRTTSEVLAIVYANSAKGTSSGGFFPDGVNGAIHTV